MEVDGPLMLYRPCDFDDLHGDGYTQDKFWIFFDKLIHAVVSPKKFTCQRFHQNHTPDDGRDYQMTINQTH